MNFWQFKFDMKKGEWKEFETIERGEQFTQSISAYKKMQNRKGDIVFFYRMDKKGIYFIAEIISDPYLSEYNTKYAIDLRIIKRLEEPFNDYDNEVYAKLETKLDPMGQGASKYLLKEEDRGSELYSFLMNKTDALNSVEYEINPDDYKEIEEIKQKYIDNGYLFNAFHNLNLIRGEVKHLAFIGNLLNPYGNHFKDDLFLKHFIQSLLDYQDLEENEILNNFINDKPTVLIEKTIYDEDDRAIGRVDLWLESDNYIIAIEGKIEAKDNKGQLKKYNSYLKNQDKKCLLLYLTLKKGEEPEKIDINELSNFHLMNFEEDILDFIDASISDENITDNIENTLLDYKDALLKYIYKFHLSFQYSHELILAITKDKKTFKKFEKIKESYYRNTLKYKNSVVEDIAENFEYAKAYIELQFFHAIENHINAKMEEYIYNPFYLWLRIDSASIAHDIDTIAKARIKRLTSNGKIEVSFFNTNNFYINIFVDCYGIVYDDKIKPASKLNYTIFKSENISNLLDEKYMQKQIATIFDKKINIDR